MVAQRGEALFFGVRGDAQRLENGDERVVRHDHRVAVGVVVLGSNAITPGELRQ